MINLDAMKFETLKTSEGDKCIRASLRLEAEMFITQAPGDTRPGFEAYAKESLSRTIVNMVYGDIQDYVHLMQTYVRQLNPDPRQGINIELLNQIDALEDKFKRTFR